MSKVTRWFVTVGLYAVGIALLFPLVPKIASHFTATKIVGNALLLIFIVVIFLGANFLVGMIEGEVKRRKSS